MKERLLEFLRAENKTSAQLAEEIGVQASGISHILSGRNNPSLDFVLKMLEKYQFLSTDWLLFGKGTMYADLKMHSLFDDIPVTRTQNELPLNNKEIEPEIDFHDIEKNKSLTNTVRTSEKSTGDIIKIVWFYQNSSFEEFIPRK